VQRGKGGVCITANAAVLVHVEDGRWAAVARTWENVDVVRLLFA
jgi:hypothetical protein